MELALCFFLIIHRRVICCCEHAHNAVTTICQLEYDHKSEWETRPCTPTKSHPEQTAAEINTCHIVEESTISHSTLPTPPELPPVVEPPCTTQYIWDEIGSFAFKIQASHSQTIQDEGFESYFTVLPAFGFGGSTPSFA